MAPQPVQGSLTLFDRVYPKRAATLEETRMSEQRMLVLVALVDIQAGDPIGHHAFRIQTHLVDKAILPDIERNAIGSRLKELARDYGFVVKVGEKHVAKTGRPEKTFAPTADGAEWVRIYRQSRRADAA